MNKYNIRSKSLGYCKKCGYIIREYVDLENRTIKPYKAVFDISAGGLFCSCCFYKGNSNIK